MVDPVVAADGLSYERAAIEAAFRGNDARVAQLPHQMLVPNVALAKLIRRGLPKPAPQAGGPVGSIEWVDSPTAASDGSTPTPKQFGEVRWFLSQTQRSGHGEILPEGWASSAPKIVVLEREFGGRTPMSGQRVSYVAKNGFDAKGNACILATDVAFEERAPSPRASPRSVAQTASGGKARVRGTCLWFSNAYGFVAVDEEFWARMGFEPSSQKPRFEVFIHRAAVEHLPDACVRKGDYLEFRIAAYQHEGSQQQRARCVDVNLLRPAPPDVETGPPVPAMAETPTYGQPRIPYEQQRLRRDERAIGGLDRAAAFHQQYLAQSQQYRAPAGEPTARETSPVPEATSYDARSYHSHSSASGSSGFFQQGPY
jgi:hypothetical protein